MTFESLLQNRSFPLQSTFASWVFGGHVPTGFRSSWKVQLRSERRRRGCRVAPSRGEGGSEIERRTGARTDHVDGKVRESKGRKRRMGDGGRMSKEESDDVHHGREFRIPWRRCMRRRRAVRSNPRTVEGPTTTRRRSSNGWKRPVLSCHGILVFGDGRDPSTSVASSPCHVDDSNPNALVRRRRFSSSRGMRSVRTNLPFGSFLSSMTSVDVWPRVWTNQHPALSSFPSLVQGSLTFPTHPPNPAGPNPGGNGTVCVSKRGGGDASCSTPPEGSKPIPANQAEITTSVELHTVHTTPWRVQEDGGWSPRCVP